MSKPVSAPGCFGAASVFSHDSTICQECPAFQECAAAALQRLESIKQIVNVSDLLAKHQKAQIGQRKIRAARRQEAVEQAPKPVQGTTQKPVITEPVERTTPVAKVTFEIDHDTQQVIARIPNQKAAQQAIVLCKANKIEIAKESLTNGLNPFDDTGPKYLQVACQMLLADGFTRATLREELKERLEWSDTTAASHVSIAVGLLPAFDIAKVVGDLFVLSPSIS